MKKWIENIVWFDRKKGMRHLMLFFCVVCILFIPGWRLKRQDPVYEGNGEPELIAVTRDGSIFLRWKNPLDKEFCGMELLIRSEEGEEKIGLEPSCMDYEFRDGIHGKLYSFELQAQFEGREPGPVQKKSALFLNYEKLPDLPLLNVTTAGFQEPDFSEAERPEGCWGQTITGNDYVKGMLTLSRGGVPYIEEETEIRIRGNTSAFGDKKPYKIKLAQAEDLLEREEPIYKSREWVLLDDATLLRTVTGSRVAKQCGMEWQPEYQFVNVMINGDWKGCYLLIEAVSKGEGRLNIDSSGFIIENDVYWWNQDDVYFRTDRQIYEVGYTFKYPSSAEVSEADKERIRSYMNDFETALYEGEEDYSDYIDLNSFAAWLLVHDIMGTADAGGANMYLYKETFSQDDPEYGKIKMGPVWDFGSAYENGGIWSSIHTGPISDVFYFPKLLEQQDFRREYRAVWDSVADTIEADVLLYLEELYEEQGEALQESRHLESVKTGEPAESVKGEICQVWEWLDVRLPWLDRMKAGFR